MRRGAHIGPNGGPGGEPVVLPGLLPASIGAGWLTAIDRRIAELPPGHEDLQATSGSLRLTALGEPWWSQVQQTLRGGAAQALLRGRCLATDCWARCQWPAATRPAGQHPHAWHQDGALGSRFDEGARLRHLVTLWLPLLDCGTDAPSLEWIAPSPLNLLHPRELDDAALYERFGAQSRRHATLRAGDALVFGGALLHRTHVTAAMTRRRVSVELRFER